MSQQNAAENQPNEVKDVSAESSTVEGLESQATPPAEANPALEQEEQRVPYSRFREVVQEKNSLGNRIAELESQLQQAAEKDSGPSAYERALERFKSLGLDERSTKALADSAAEIASEISDKRVSKVEEIQEQRNLVEDLRAFNEEYPDAERYAGVMTDIFEQSDSATQELIVKNTDIGFQFLLAKAKELVIDDVVEQARKEEREIAQNGFATKRALSGAGGRAAAKVESIPLPEDIPNLSDKEYAKHRDFILSPKYAEYLSKQRKGG